MADSAPLEAMLSITDAARALQVSRSTVYRYIADGHLAAIEHAKRRWIEPAQIADYLNRARAIAAKQRAIAAKRRAIAAKRQRPRARERAPQANSLTVLLDSLDGVVLSDGEHASLAWLAGFEDYAVDIAAVITRARQTL